MGTTGDVCPDQLKQQEPKAAQGSGSHGPLVWALRKLL